MDICPFIVLAIIIFLLVYNVFLIRKNVLIETWFAVILSYNIILCSSENLGTFI